MAIEVVFEGVVLRPSEFEIHLGTVLGENSMKKKVKVGINELYKKRTNMLLYQFRLYVIVWVLGVGLISTLHRRHPHRLDKMY
jgi:DNA-directed RNA polymerase subunit E'/Rpb7